MLKDELTSDLKDVANKRRAGVIRNQLKSVIADIEEGKYESSDE